MTIQFPTTPVTPTPAPWTRLRLAEATPGAGRATTVAHADVTLRGDAPATAQVDVTTWRMGRTQASTTLDVGGDRADRETAALVDALAGSALLARGIDGSARRVPSAEWLLVRWTGTDGRELGARLPLVPGVPQRALDAADQPVLDAYRAWRDASGVAAAVSAQVVAPA